MSDTVPAPQPFRGDPDSGGFFDAVCEGRLDIRRCTSCHEWLHLPLDHCHHCGSSETAWATITPRGRVHSFTVAEHQVHPAFPVPYTVVLVELDDAPHVRLVGHLPGRHELAIGQPMEAVLDASENNPVLAWRAI